MKKNYELLSRRKYFLLLAIVFSYIGLSAQQLTKMVDLTTADPEEVFEYSIAFTCPSTITGDCEQLIITDVLPPGVELVNMPSGCLDCSYDMGTRTFTFGPTTVANGSTRSLGIQVRFPNNVLDGEVASNTATINYEQPNGTPRNETTLPVTTTATNGIVVVFDDSPHIAKGSNGVYLENDLSIRYELYIGHRSPDPVSALVLEEILPEGAFFGGGAISTQFPVNSNCASPVSYNVEYLLADVGNPTGTWIASTINPLNTGSGYFGDLNPGANSATTLGIIVPATSWVRGIRYTYLNVPGGTDCFNPEINSYKALQAIALFDETVTGFPNPTAGDMIENCATVSSVELSPTEAEDCITNTVETPEHIIFTRKADLTNTGPYEPGEIVTFSLRYEQNNGGSFPVVNPTIIDILPPEFEFLGITQVVTNGSATTINPGSVTLDPVLIATLDFDGVAGQTRLDFTWNDATMNGITISPLAFQGISVEYQVRIRSSAPDGAVLTNTAYFYDPIESTGCPLDVNDIDNDGSTTDRVCTSSRSINILYPPNFAGLDSYKEVRGNLDTEFSRFPNSGMVSPSGNIEYVIDFENPANLPQTIDNVVLVDVLPHVGDRGVVANNELRESGWRPTFTATTLADLQAYVAAIPGATLFFSTECEPCLAADLGAPVTDLGSCSPPNWTTTPPMPLSNICAFKIEYGTTFELAPGESTMINMNMEAPVGVPTDGSIAWNSFGYVGTKEDGTSLLASEPIKVGISAMPPVCTEPTAMVTSSVGSYCAGGAVTDNATIDVIMVLNGDQAGIIAGTDYDMAGGSAYMTLGNIDVSGGSGQFTGLMHNTEYTIRVFNMDNSCFEDYTVTTPDLQPIPARCGRSTAVKN